MEPRGPDDLKASASCAVVVGKGKAKGAGKGGKKYYMSGLFYWGRKSKFKNIQIMQKMLGAGTTLILVFGSLLTHTAWTDFNRNCCVYEE